MNLLAIYNLEYNVFSSDKEYDTYHLETNQGAVKILDNNKNVLGTLEEYMFKGKLVESVNFKTIKNTGLYRVRNLAGFPTEVNNTKVQILSVKAIGEINNPDVINYQIIDQGGSVFNKTIVGSTESEWSNGGTSLQKTINRLINDFGNRSDLNTSNKTNFVGAINELNDKLSGLTEDFDNYSREFGASKNHNHDSRYLRIDADSSLKSTINVDANGGLGINRGNGITENMLKATSVGGIEIGNQNSPLNIYATNDLLHNGKKVWTEVNDGIGSKMNADLLHGVSGSKFAHEDKSTTFNKVQNFNSGAVMKGVVKINDIEFVSRGEYTSIQKDGVELLSFEKGGTFNMHEARLKSNAKGNAKMSFVPRNSAKESFGFELEEGLGGQKIAFKNYSTNEQVFEVSAANNTVSFNDYIEIAGRRLYIQETQPSGQDVPFGSIWIR